MTIKVKCDGCGEVKEGVVQIHYRVTIDGMTTQFVKKTELHACKDSCLTTVLQNMLSNTTVVRAHAPEKIELLGHVYTLEKNA